MIHIKYKYILCKNLKGEEAFTACIGKTVSKMEYDRTIFTDGSELSTMEDDYNHYDQYILKTHGVLVAEIEAKVITQVQKAILLQVFKDLNTKIKAQGKYSSFFVVEKFAPPELYMFNTTLLKLSVTWTEKSCGHFPRYKTTEAFINVQLPFTDENTPDELLKRMEENIISVIENVEGK